MPRIGAGDDLGALILAACAREQRPLAPGDVVVIAQKIVSKSEGRMVRLAEITPAEPARELAARTGKDPRLVELILRESTRLLRVGREVLIVEHRSGFVLANAGIDQSNVDAAQGSAALLLPLDCNASAARIRARLEAGAGFAPGVLIIDSIGRAWRRGTVGQTLGACGVPVVVDLRGRTDLNGRPLRASDLAHADELAAAASILMGQADESRPVVIIRGLAIAPERQPQTAVALQRAVAEDLFR